ncbi:Predicted periplasmic lipoprotein [Raoultella terrigena]|uniref:Predicted periplasmic lipoprotein n=1 Tax=Raoultella terrigena TaxID=577 RepID=A0A4U9D9Y2_RAOTE|nr:Predicted periplasmic lipoprotein [Raoultella terrigena]
MKKRSVKAGPVRRNGRLERLLQRDVSYPGGKEGTYPGTRASAQMLGNSDANWGTKSLVALDMPLTAVMDTLLLPWDMFRTDSSIKSRVEKSEKETLATQFGYPASINDNTLI